mgnify:CR=1 FL=1
MDSQLKDAFNAMRKMAEAGELPLLNEEEIN